MLAYKPRAGEIPTEPGVYRFSDASGRVLYVGKAKNLRARLSNYFAPLRSLHERTRRMVTTAASVDWTVVGNDYEALRLEYTWIKEYNPPFNVQYRDDKSYPFLAITLGDEAPRALVTRRTGIPGAKYFGPFPRVWAINDTVDLLLKVFPIRTCKDSDYRRAMATGKPCFAGQIGRCFGPCSGLVSLEEHRTIVDRFVAFMQTYDRRIISELTEQMNAAAEAQQYERAASYRDQLRAAEAVLTKSAVVLPGTVDVDVLGIEHDELAAAVQQFVVRGGRVRGVRAWTVDKELDVPLGELVDSVVQNTYGEVDPPAEIIVPELPDDHAALEEWLSGRAGRRVRIRVARRGAKAAVLATANQNAKHALLQYKNRRSADFTARSRALEDIQEALDMIEAPLRMECFDVSHLGGTNIVASMVVFEDGLPRKDEYRRFNIASAADDTDAIYQAVRRRLAYLADADGQSGEDDVQQRKFVYRPNLLIVDGGEPQVAAAQRALGDSGVEGIQLCGLAKRLEEIWLPDADFPVILPRNSDALFLFQRIRDEAHRFALTHQRTRRKRDISTTLGEVPGLGPRRIKRLLRHFGSVARLRNAHPDEIAEVRGIGPTLAQAIHDHLASKGQRTSVG